MIYKLSIRIQQYYQLSYYIYIKINKICVNKIIRFIKLLLILLMDQFQFGRPKIIEDQKIFKKNLDNQQQRIKYQILFLNSVYQLTPTSNFNIDLKAYLQSKQQKLLYNFLTTINSDLLKSQFNINSHTSHYYDIFLYFTYIKKHYLNNSGKKSLAPIEIYSMFLAYLKFSYQLTQGIEQFFCKDDRFIKFEEILINGPKENDNEQEKIINLMVVLVLQVLQKCGILIRIIKSRNK